MAQSWSAVAFWPCSSFPFACLLPRPRCAFKALGIRTHGSVPFLLAYARLHMTEKKKQGRMHHQCVLLQILVLFHLISRFGWLVFIFVVVVVLQHLLFIDRAVGIVVIVVVVVVAAAAAAAAAVIVFIQLLSVMNIRCHDCRLAFRTGKSNQSVDRSVGRSVSRSVGPSVGRFVDPCSRPR